MAGDRIPPSSALFFQEYRFEDLDSTQHQRLIMERLLAYGNRAEVRWVFQRYGEGAVKSWLQAEGRFKLPRLRYRLFCAILDLSPIEHERVKKRIWPH